MMNCSDAAEEKEEKTAYDSLKDCSPDNAASFLAAADECNSFKCTKCHDLVSDNYSYTIASTSLFWVDHAVGSCDASLGYILCF